MARASCRRCRGEKQKVRTYPYAYTTGKASTESAAVYFRQAVAFDLDNVHYQYNATQVINLNYDLIYVILALFPESVKFMNPVSEKYYKEVYLLTKE